MTAFFPFVNGYKMRNQSSETRHSQQLSQLLGTWESNRPKAVRVWPPCWRGVLSVMAWSIKGNVKNIFLPPPDAQVYFATFSPSHQRRRSSDVLPWVVPSQQLHLQ